jgi:hypothetical protein
MGPPRGITTEHVRDAHALLELVDTRRVDLSDTPPLDGKPTWSEAISVEGLPRWRPMRQDDNGHRSGMRAAQDPRVPAPLADALARLADWKRNAFEPPPRPGKALRTTPR